MAAAVQVIQSAGSATGLAKWLKLPRQTVHYHLRELEKEGFGELVERRPRGNCLERFVRATARRSVISPFVLGTPGAGATHVRLSQPREVPAWLVVASLRRPFS